MRIKYGAALLCAALLLSTCIACTRRNAPIATETGDTITSENDDAHRVYLRESELIDPFVFEYDLYIPFSGEAISYDQLEHVYAALASVADKDMRGALLEQKLLLDWDGLPHEGSVFGAYEIQALEPEGYTILRLKETASVYEACFELIFARQGDSYMPHSAILYLPNRSDEPFFRTVGEHVFYITSGEGVTGTGIFEHLIDWYNVDTKRTELRYTDGFYTEGTDTAHSFSAWSFEAEESGLTFHEGGGFSLALKAHGSMGIDYYDDDWQDPGIPMDSFKTEQDYLLQYDEQKNAFYVEGNADTYLLDLSDTNGKKDVWVTIFRDNLEALRQSAHAYQQEVAAYYLDGVRTERATPDRPESTPVVRIDPDATLSPQLKEAMVLNEDVFGWITIPNTSIDEAILYDAQWFYSEHNIRKELDGAGCVYAFYKVLTKNITLQGRNMRRTGQLFHDLHKLQDNGELLREEANRLCAIHLFGFSKWEIFALYETRDIEPVETLQHNVNHLSTASASEVEAWIAFQKERSELKDILDVPVSADDFLMTLVTGGDLYEHADSQSRLYVFLKAVG